MYMVTVIIQLGRLGVVHQLINKKNLKVSTQLKN